MDPKSGDVLLKNSLYRTWALIIALWMIANPKSIPIAIQFRNNPVNLRQKSAILRGSSIFSAQHPSLKSVVSVVINAYLLKNVVLTEQAAASHKPGPSCTYSYAAHFASHGDTIGTGLQGPLELGLARGDFLASPSSQREFSPPHILFLQAHWSHLRARVSHPPLKHPTISWIGNLQRLF